jgi:DNA polymerase-3 subunit gamma/tau
MSYQALARTWRPRTFQELVGQEHVVKALVNALEDERLHHAYLFTGTRGVGKTTIARILAKCLNCEEGVVSAPCGKCSACEEIDAGRFVDLLEVDAASRTKVDDTRDLLDNVQYAPARGRYKVYLIDEVHMLSNHSFNALLKTLEEPPPHVKFLLATTDPQKLPVTVLSRCLQFNLKRLPQTMIRDRLEKVTGKEGIEAEAAALDQLARAADGSMRDALSLLDQAAAYCAGKLVETEVRAMLGTLDQGAAIRLLRGLAEGDAKGLMNMVVELDQMVPDYVSALDELALMIQKAALVQVAEDVLDPGDSDSGEIRDLAESIPAEDLQLFYQIALIGKRDLPLAPTMRVGFEMVLLRMLAFRPADVAPAGDGAGGSRAGNAASTGDAASSRRRAGAKANSRPTPSAATAKASEPPARLRPEQLSEWERAIGMLELSGAVRQLAQHCEFAGLDENILTLVLDDGASHLQTDALTEKLRQALSTGVGLDVRLRVALGKPADETPAQKLRREDMERQQAAERSIETDPNVLAVTKAFGATVDPASIKPVKH